MGRLLFIFFLLSGCGGVAWNTTVADHPNVRWAMLASVVPGQTTEKGFTARWGNPTQKMREGGQVSYIYRSMTNPADYYAPQFGDSSRFVVVTFQYGLAVGGYSSDEQGCRATFPPRPPGPNFDNPTTVHPVNCGNLGRRVASNGGTLPPAAGTPGASGMAGAAGSGAVQNPQPGLTSDIYDPGKYK